jgi:hypothetical protein
MTTIRGATTTTRFETVVAAAVAGSDGAAAAAGSRLEEVLAPHGALIQLLNYLII